jgi:hypothetical protein
MFVSDTSYAATERLARSYETVAQEVRGLVLEVADLGTSTMKALKLAVTAADDARRASQSAKSSAESASLASQTARDFCLGAAVPSAKPPGGAMANESGGTNDEAIVQGNNTGNQSPLCPRV